MNTAILKYYEIAAINTRETLTYTANFLSRTFIVLLRIWVYTKLYTLSFASAHTASINGMSLSMVVWSIMFAQSFQMSTKSSMVIRQVDEDIKNGVIAYSLNKPYSYVLFQYFTHLGKMVPNLLFLVPVSCIMTMLFVGPLALTPAALGAAAVLFLLGTTLDFLIAFLISLSAFWIEDATAFRWLFEKGQIVFGGQIVPLALFPGVLRQIGELLPFSQFYYSSSRMMVGYDPHLFLKYLAIQASWLLIFGVLVNYIFAKSIRYVSINGG